MHSRSMQMQLTIGSAVERVPRGKRTEHDCDLFHFSDAYVMRSFAQNRNMNILKSIICM